MPAPAEMGVKTTYRLDGSTSVYPPDFPEEDPRFWAERPCIVCEGALAESKAPSEPQKGEIVFSRQPEAQAASKTP